MGFTCALDNLVGQACGQQQAAGSVLDDAGEASIAGCCNPAPLTSAALMDSLCLHTADAADLGPPTCNTSTCSQGQGAGGSKQSGGAWAVLAALVPP